MVTVLVTCEDLTIFSGFSPNGDGVNDFFTILGIENFPSIDGVIKYCLLEGTITI